jgi:hypothetical protein
MNTDEDLELLTEDLRADLPAPADEARLRSRLVAAGVLGGAGVMAPGGAAAAGVASTSGAFAKVLALPLAAKVGGVLALAGAATVPWLYGAPGTAEHAPNAGAASAPTTPTTRLGTRVETRRTAQPATLPATESATPLAVSAVSTEAARGARASRALGPAPKPAPEAAPALDSPASAGTPTAAVAVGSFPVAASAPVDDGTLREETALLERALAALSRGDRVTARRELETHAARFPNGHLAPERERALERTLAKETQP